MSNQPQDYVDRLLATPDDEMMQALVRDLKREIFAIVSEATSIDMNCGQSPVSEEAVMQVRSAALRILSHTEKAQLMLNAARDYDEIRRADDR